MARSELGTIIIQDGPYKAGDINPLATATSAQMNALRLELIELRLRSHGAEGIEPHDASR